MIAKELEGVDALDLHLSIALQLDLELCCDFPVLQTSVRPPVVQRGHLRPVVHDRSSGGSPPVFHLLMRLPAADAPHESHRLCTAGIEIQVVSVDAAVPA